MKFDPLTPFEVQNRFAKVLGVSARRLWLTAKDLEEVLPWQNPARLSQLLEEVATLPAKDLEALQARLESGHVLLLKDWAAPFWARVQARLSAEEKAQDNLQEALRRFEASLEALQDATKHAKKALRSGNPCDAFKEALEGAQAALEGVQQAQATLEAL